MLASLTLIKFSKVFVYLAAATVFGHVYIYANTMRWSTIFSIDLLGWFNYNRRYDANKQ